MLRLADGVGRRETILDLAAGTQVSFASRRREGGGTGLPGSTRPGPLAEHDGDDYIKGRLVFAQCGQKQPFGRADAEAFVPSHLGRFGLACDPTSVRWLDAFSFVPVTLGLILIAQLGPLATFSYAVVVGVPVGFRRAARYGRWAVREVS